MRRMIPVRYIFRSRWFALVWAVGICITAVEFAGGGGGATDASNAAGVNVETAALMTDIQ